MAGLLEDDESRARRREATVAERRSRDVLTRRHRRRYVEMLDYRHMPAEMSDQMAQGRHNQYAPWLQNAIVPRRAKPPPDP